MCEYCKSIYDNEIDLLNDADKDESITDGIVKDGDSYKIILIDHEYNHALYDVKFCPCCGRKL